MYLCCEMKATSYICVELIFSPLPASPKFNRKSVNPLPFKYKLGCRTEANVPVFHFSNLAEQRSPGGGCCSNAASCFKVPPEVEFCWTSTWGACQVEHTELVSPWLCCLPALLPASKASGTMVCRERQVYCPPSPPHFWFSLGSWCLENSAAWTAFFVFSSRWGIKPLPWGTSQTSFFTEK